MDVAVVVCTVVDATAVDVAVVAVAAFSDSLAVLQLNLTENCTNFVGDQQMKWTQEASWKR